MMTGGEFRHVAGVMLRRARARSCDILVAIVYFRSCWVPIEAGQLAPGPIVICQSDNDNEIRAGWG